MMQKHLRHIAMLCVLLWAPSLPAADRSARPETWAKPVKTDHLRNFYKLDDKVYRSAQPDKKGFRELERLGIQNVLSFREFHSDDDAGGTALKLFRVKMDAGRIRDDQVIEALHIINSADGPVLIHCWHGSDRTGLVSAMYRIVFQNWSKEDAIDELIHGGYGYHALYKNIPEYIRKADVDKMKRAFPAEGRTLLEEVRKFGKHTERIERSENRVSVQDLIREGASLADRLRPVLEDLYVADYDAVVNALKGFTVRREEAIVIEPDASFFSDLAKKHGMESDILYFDFLAGVRPDGSWPVYIEQQTDVGGCTRYGEGHLAKLYQKGKALLPKMTGYYADETAEMLKEISVQLTAATCACEDRQSVVKELQLFLELNKNSDIAGAVRSRLEDVQKQGSTMRYQCVGGQ